MFVPWGRGGGDLPTQTAQSSFLTSRAALGAVLGPAGSSSDLGRGCKASPARVQLEELGLGCSGFTLGWRTLQDTESSSSGSLQELWEYFRVHRENTQSSLASLPPAAPQVPLEMGKSGTINHSCCSQGLLCSCREGEELCVAEWQGRICSGRRCSYPQQAARSGRELSSLDVRPSQAQKNPPGATQGALIPRVAERVPKAFWEQKFPLQSF